MTPPKPPTFLTRRRFLMSASAALGAASLGLYAWKIEPTWAQYVERDLPIAHLPPELQGKRLVQLSDLHVGPAVDDDYLLAAFERVAALQPDLLVVTGDLLTHRAERRGQYEQLYEVLRHLPRAAMGSFAILGNHDYGVGWGEPLVAKRVAREAERAGLRVLRNELAPLPGLDLIGVDELLAGQAHPRAALARRSQAAALALCHNPDGVDELDWGDYQGWVLAGHTHGGQCKPPFLAPPLVPVRNKNYVAGEVEGPRGLRLYINRGLGHAVLPVRFNVRPEVTVFRLSAP
jgi:predicted MPP superfamily phosphohydrolase